MGNEFQKAGVGLDALDVSEFAPIEFCASLPRDGGGAVVAHPTSPATKQARQNNSGMPMRFISASMKYRAA
jgi:hypothetical protein